MDRIKTSFHQKLKDIFQDNNAFTILSIFLLMGLGILGQIGFLVSIIAIVALYYIRKTTWDEMGLHKPKSWIKTIGLGIGLTVLILVVFTLFINPLLMDWFPIGSKDVSRFNAIKDNEWLLVGAILSAWVTAGFAEELIWRGYILKNMALLFGDTKFAWICSVLLSSVAFGALHFYQGAIGMVQTAIVGVIFGIVYILNGKKSLWLNILIHGMIDTLSMIAFYLGKV